MSHAIPTVRVVSPVSEDNPTGYVVINQADFDHTKHAAWVEDAPETSEGAAPAAESADAPAPAKRRAKSAE